jgi:hypothetical protein
MPPQLGDSRKQARRVRQLTLGRLAVQVTKEDNTAISPPYLFDIKVYHRVPAPHVLSELARVLELDAETLLALAGAADTVVREYLDAYPQHTEAVIKLFWVAQQRGFREWDHLWQRIEHGSKGGSLPCPESDRED